MFLRLDVFLVVVIVNGLVACVEKPDFLSVGRFTLHTPFLLL